MLEIHNHGPLITSTNYWGGEADQAGKIIASVNAGAIRLLMPRIAWPYVEDMRRAKEVVLSRGPWPAMGLAEAVEMLFDDRSDHPYALHLANETFDVLPGEPKPGREWLLTVWYDKKGKPHKGLERICHWRRVAKIPWLKPWKG